MTARNKYYLILFVLWPVGGLLLMILSIKFNGLFAIGIVIYMFTLLYLASKIKCPKCGMFVGKVNISKRHNHFPLALINLTVPQRLTIGKYCEKCGHDLSLGK